MSQYLGLPEKPWDRHTQNAPFPLPRDFCMHPPPGTALVTHTPASLRCSRHQNDTHTVSGKAGDFWDISHPLREALSSGKLKGTLIHDESPKMSSSASPWWGFRSHLQPPSTLALTRSPLPSPTCCWSSLPLALQSLHTRGRAAALQDRKEKGLPCLLGGWEATWACTTVGLPPNPGEQSLCEKAFSKGLFPPVHSELA